MSVDDIKPITPPKSNTLSIDDIIKKHSTNREYAFGLDKKKRPEMILRAKTAPPVPSKDRGAALSPTEANQSMADVVRQSNALLRQLSDEPHLSAGLNRRSSDATNSTARVTSSGRSATSFEAFSGPTGDNTPMMEYLRSKRLNRLITLRRASQAGQIVSLADVGNSNGYPVLVFLGLGCVRYLIALFDELAETLNLRLICIDRWGLGKSTDVPSEQRGLLEWASVVDEVMDQLKIRKFGIMAHSAGAPYALAVAYKLEERICGKAHLLAPWVSAEIDGGEQQ